MLPPTQDNILLKKKEKILFIMNMQKKFNISRYRKQTPLKLIFADYTTADHTQARFNIQCLELETSKSIETYLWVYTFWLHFQKIQ